MAAKLNCWEHKQCGREPGGSRVTKLGTCPASTHDAATGLNDGKKAGRICWVIAGTLCGGKVQGSFAQKRVTCVECDFYKKVMAEQGDAFSPTLPGQTE